MTGRTESLGLALLVAVASGCGSSETSLTIANEHGEGGELEITNVLIQDCITRYWEQDPYWSTVIRSRSAPGAMTIAHGESHTFELTPGCHDVLVARNKLSSPDDKLRYASARVVLREGDTATWVPWRVTENESWWCYDEDDCDE